MWQQWLNGILGLWVILMGFLNFTGSTATWALVITGIVVAILGFWGASATSGSSSRLATR